MPNPIITCALTGGAHNKRVTPALPEQPDEIVAQGIDAWKAGAAVLHVHARDPQGQNTMDPAIYGEIHERLCAQTDAIVQLTTGGGLGMSSDERLTTALLGPEMCSLNMGFVLFFIGGRELMLSNPRSEIERFAAEMRARGVKPELEVYNPTMLEEAEHLIEHGLIDAPYDVNLVLNTHSQGGARGTWQNLAMMVQRVPSGANVTVSAMGPAQLPLTTMALAMGLNIRVGLEDNVRYRRGEYARDNAQLVQRAVRIARELELQPASPAEARERLGCRGREPGCVPTPIVAGLQPVTKAPQQPAFDAGEFRP